MSKRPRTSKRSSSAGLAGSRFPIVGIGASAGGLAALTKLFARVPEECGIAFVIVVHLAPEHESHLSEILQPHVPMPVKQVLRSVKIEPNHIYLIPPNANLDTVDTHLRLTELEARRRERAPIDHFFRTLAESHDGQAIGVILSGTGSDGTLGLRRIKELGGLTIVQDPAEAEYDGMPQSAIEAAPVDLVLPLEEIPQALLQFAHTRPQLSVPRDGEPVEAASRQLLQKVFALIRARTGRDFSQYKRSTLLRRIARRMQFNHVQEPLAYVEILRKKPEEVQALADDLLITVTSFFRDPEVFETLEQQVVPNIFKGKGPGDTVRAWSVGCATGEEAYSLAILLLEEAARRESQVTIQVFASDLHPPSLEKGREGVYPGDIETDVRPDRLRRYFQRENGGYRIRKEVRELVLFTPHNVLSDPPFSRLDLVSCRNLLIYLQRDLQQKVVEILHYALNPDGFLLLGASESVEAGELFRVEEKKACIYRKRNVPGPEPRLPVFPLGRGQVAHEGRRRDQGGELVEFGRLHQRLVEEHGPPSVLVSPDDNVVHFSAHAGRYLTHPGGAPTTSVFKLVREELRIELRTALASARAQKRVIRSRPTSVTFDGTSARVIMDVRPALEPEQEGFILLMFDEWPEEPQDEAAKRGEPPDGKLLLELRQLQADKEQTEQRLQAIIEEYETSQEEIRASNEELQSSNEELRSTLEELETSKEELQSMNEELQTVNQENRHKVEELAQLSSDLQNLFAATDIATLFLDRELRILRFTPKVAELFNVRVADRGRPLTDLTHRLGYDQLEADAVSVLERLVQVEREVCDESGRWYLTRVLPYRDGDDRIAGVVVTFVEITRRKQAENEVRRAKEYFEDITEALPEPLLVLKSDLSVNTANQAFHEQFQISPEELRGRRIYEIGEGQWDIPSLRKLLEEILDSDTVVTGFEVEHVFENLGRRVMLLNARRISDMDLILVGIQDITERHDAEQARREIEMRYRVLAELSPEAILVAVDEKLVYANGAAARLLGAASGEHLVGRSPFEFLDASLHDGMKGQFRDALEQRGVDARRVYRWRRLDGRSVDIEIVAGRSDWENRPAVQIVARDVTERELRDDELREANRQKDEYLAMLGHELRNPHAAIRSASQLLAVSGSGEQPVDRALGVLQRQTSHMAEIIDGLLEVSRIARGKVHLQLAPLEVRQVIERTLDDHASAIAGTGLELATDLAPEPLWVEGDDIRLAQVFDNLIGNAVKFTDAPGKITVSLDKQDSQAVVRVQDTGVGIRPEMLPRIFDSFQQERQDAARSAGGLGLGLALARGLVELHRGTITARSAGVGKGAEFEVRLPLSSPPEDSPEESPRRSSPPRRVLVVEDNADAAEMLSELLTIAGHEVEVVATGRQALELLRERGADVILCDLGLPGMSGYQLAREVRRDPALNGAYLVALTGYGQAEDRRKSAEHGFDAHLVKPVDLEVLNAVLARARPAGD